MVTGTESRFQDMKMLVKELVVDGQETGGVAPATAITDVEDDNTVNATFSNTEVKAIVDANAGAINDILAALRAHGIVAS